MSWMRIRKYMTWTGFSQCEGIRRKIPRNSCNHPQFLGLGILKDFYGSNDLPRLRDNTSSGTSCSAQETGRAHQVAAITITVVVSKEQFLKHRHHAVIFQCQITVRKVLQDAQYGSLMTKISCWAHIQRGHNPSKGRKEENGKAITHIH